jgi:uncharacterized protein YegL
MLAVMVDADDGMPGQGVARRPLPFFWLCDVSGSMAGDKIASLNYAVRNALPEALAAAREQIAQLTMRTLAFSSGARWIDPAPVPIERYAWTDLQAGGTTDLGHGLRMMADQLRMPPMPQRALPPVLVLLSDGEPTDDWQKPLDELLALPWGQKSVRLAIGIGQQANHAVLERFIHNPEIKPLQANHPEELTRYIRWASTAVAGSVLRSQMAPRDGGPPSAAIPPPPAPVPVPGAVW